MGHIRDSAAPRCSNQAGSPHAGGAPGLCSRAERLRRHARRWQCDRLFPRLLELHFSGRLSRGAVAGDPRICRMALLSCLCAAAQFQARRGHMFLNSVLGICICCTHVPRGTRAWLHRRHATSQPGTTATGWPERFICHLLSSRLLLLQRTCSSCMVLEFQLKLDVQHTLGIDPSGPPT